MHGRQRPDIGNASTSASSKTLSPGISPRTILQKMQLDPFVVHGRCRYFNR